MKPVQLQALAEEGVTEICATPVIRGVRSKRNMTILLWANGLEMVDRNSVSRRVAKLYSKVGLYYALK